MKTSRSCNASTQRLHGLPALTVLLMVSVSYGYAAPAPAHGGRHAFHFIEASARLGADLSPEGTSTTDVDLVDVDGDGDLDIFFTEGTDSLAGRPNRLLINNGKGRFSDESSLRLPAPNNQNSAKTDFGDVDGDGDLDAIVAGVLGEDLLLNDGKGFFIPANGQIPAPIVNPPQGRFDISADVRLADIDGDGDLDILLSNENPFNPLPTGGEQNRIWINDSTGVFSDDTAARLPLANDQTGAMLPGDIDGDGDLDIVVLNRGQDFVLINIDGAGHFVDQTASRFPVTSDTSRGGALRDLDGDGDLDLVVGNSRNEPVALYRNDGHGVFTARAFGHVPLPDETDAGLVVVDLDEDGDDDVYLPNAGAFLAGHGFLGGPDRYFRNNGRARFKEQTARHFGTPPSDPTTAAAFGDLDCDGDLDLVTAGSGPGGSERLFLNVRHHRHHGE
jgi:FG-GAP-like repeat